MIPKFRAFHIATKEMCDVSGWDNLIGVKIKFEDGDIEWYELDSIILMQSIGINIKEGDVKISIYEDDILEVTDYDQEETTIHKVIYGGPYYPAFELDPPLSEEVNSFAELMQSGAYDFKVIGNIHEHPHLLGEK